MKYLRNFIVAVVVNSPIAIMVLVFAWICWQPTDLRYVGHHVNRGMETQWMLPPTEDTLNVFVDSQKKQYFSEWLFDFTLARLHNHLPKAPEKQLLLQADLIRTLFAVGMIGRILFLWLAFRTLSGSRCFGSLLVLLCTLPAVLPGYVPHPNDFGILFFAILLWVLAPAKISGLRLMLLPPLFLLWANWTGPGLTGLLFYLLFCLAKTIERFQMPVAEREPVLRYWLILIPCYLMHWLSPYGPAFILEPFLTARNSAFWHSPIGKPLNFSDPGAWPWIFLATIGLLIAIQVIAKSGFRIFSLLIICTFGIWPLVQFRGLNYWWPLAAALIAIHTGPLLCACCRTEKNEHSTFSSELKYCVATILLLVLAHPTWWHLVVLQKRTAEQVYRPAMPVALVLELQGQADASTLPEFRTLLTQYYQETGGKYRGMILCTPEIGSFMTMKLGFRSDMPLSLYNRPQTFDPAYWTEFEQVLAGNFNWWEITDRHQTNMIVTPTLGHDELIRRVRIAPEWVVVESAWQKGYFLAVRRHPRLPK
ncbi:MAG: hypothetical protein R3B84_09580 [Zavarzinella sp.]